MRQTTGISQWFKTGWSALWVAVCTLPAIAADGPQFAIPPQAQHVLQTYCASCHGADAAEGQVRLDQLHRLTLKSRLDLLNKVQQQLLDRLMPPLEADQAPTAARTRLADWVAAELDKHNASRLKAKLRQPAFGNYVDHDKLFSGEYKHLKAFTYDRRWLISEYIFDARFNRLLNHKPYKTIDGKRQFVIGDNNRRVNLTNPFLLPSHTGVRYYANTTLNGGHLLTMITNAKEAATYMVYLTKRDQRYARAIQGIMGREWEHERTSASRESFLQRFIVRVLHDLYQDQHQVLLPKFVPVEVKSTVSTSGKQIKKSPFHAAQPGSAELVLIFHSMQRHQSDGDPDERLIEKCEREWFNHGHNPRTIQRRVVFLKNYMPEWRDVIVRHRYAHKHKLPVYRPQNTAEMKTITDAIVRHRKNGDRYNDIISKCMAEWEAEFKHERIAAGPPASALVRDLVEQLFVRIYEHPPTPAEAEQYTSLTRSYIESLGNLPAIEKLIQTLILRSDFVYRQEFGQG
ncbi:MAG: c-type cytochrome domain-containing protein, partial [Planctomycetaceae bacterium]